MPYKDPERQKEAQRLWYLKNKELVDARTAEKKRKLHKYVQDIKESTPCADCNKYYPYYVMQFDHVRGEKVERIALLQRKLGMRAVQEEIKKCEVVCANCHHIRTYKRLTEGQ